MADKREIKSIRNLLSKNKITLNQLNNIIKGGKGVSKKNDSIIRQYNIIRGPIGKGVRGIQDYNKESKARAKSEGRKTGLAARLVHSELDLQDKKFISKGDVLRFKNKYNLKDKDLLRIAQGNPQTDLENKVYHEIKKIFTPEKMKRLPKGASKEGPNAKLYNDLRDSMSGSEYTQDQQDINEEAAKSLQANQEPNVTTLGAEDNKEQSPLEADIEKILNKATGGSPKINKAIAENIPQIYNAIQQSGYEQRPQFGSPTNSNLLQAYDELVNRIRPEESSVSKLARRYRPVTEALGGIGGKVGGAALGSAIGLPGIGGVLGSVLGDYGANKLTNYLTQEQPEFKTLADLLRGEEGGYIRRGRRGLADIIAGTQGQSSLLSRLPGIAANEARTSILANILRSAGKTDIGSTLGSASKYLTGYNPFDWLNPSQKVPLTFLQRLRGAAAAPVRGLGNLLGSKNAARNLRTALGTAEGLYDIGKATGINDWIANKLGFKKYTPFSYSGFETGEQLANPVITNALQRSLPFLQEQSSRLLGRPVSAQEALSGLNEQLVDVLTPQVMQRNIERSGEGISRKKIQQQRNIQRANRKAQIAEMQLQQAQQQQQFENAVNLAAQRAEENELQAILGARAGNLQAQQAVLGQKITPKPALRRTVPKQSKLWRVGEEIGRVTEPIIGRKIEEAFKVNPTVGPNS